MSLLLELLAALPTGAAEALASRGLDGTIAVLRKDRPGSPELPDDLELISRGQRPLRSIAEIADEFDAVAAPLIALQANHSTVSQSGDGASQLAIGNVGRDVHLNQDPHEPH